MPKKENRNNISKDIIINRENIQIYLKEINKLDVVTPEKEKEFAKIMSDKHVSQITIDKINEQMLIGNLRFVISIAKQYQNQGLDMADLISEGNYGLIRALNNFDWTKGIRFISYAVWWIRQSILQSLNENSREIRLPVNVIQDFYKEKKKAEKENRPITEKFLTLPTTSFLDAEFDSEGRTLIDVLENTNAVKPDLEINTNDILRDELYSILSNLTERERIIIEDYHGLSGCEKTLEEIGDDFNLTKERIRQIKDKALKKLRNDSINLFDYLP